MKQALLWVPITKTCVCLSCSDIPCRLFVHLQRISTNSLLLWAFWANGSKQVLKVIHSFLIGRRSFLMSQLYTWLPLKFVRSLGRLLKRSCLNVRSGGFGTCCSLSLVPQMEVLVLQMIWNMLVCSLQLPIGHAFIDNIQSNLADRIAFMSLQLSCGMALLPMRFPVPGSRRIGWSSSRKI